MKREKAEQILKSMQVDEREWTLLYKNRSFGRFIGASDIAEEICLNSLKEIKQSKNNIDDIYLSLRILYLEGAGDLKGSGAKIACAALQEQGVSPPNLPEVVENIGVLFSYVEAKRELKREGYVELVEKLDRSEVTQRQDFMLALKTLAR